MKNRASKLGARVDKVAAGFTIIETILFIAIAGLVFTGVIVGTNGAIRRQRYKDTVQSFTDDLRDLYSIVENIEVIDYGDEKISCGGMFDTKQSEKSGRGRSDCSVYGIIARISTRNDIDNEVDPRENIDAYWMVGYDEASVRRDNTPDDIDTDMKFLQAARISSVVGLGGEGQRIDAKKASLYWGAELSLSCATMKTFGEDGGTNCAGSEEEKILKPINDSDIWEVYLLIYRSPITGAIKTLSYMNKEDPGNYDSNKDKIFKDAFYDFSTVVLGGFSPNTVDLCVTSGPSMSYDGGLRMISISENAMSGEDVRLVEADSGENKCNK